MTRSQKPRSLQIHAWFITRALRYLVVRPVAHLKLFTTHRVAGLQFVPKRGGVIVAGNHPSTMDPLVLAAALNRNVTFLAKAELWRVPVLKHFVRLMGQIPVDRGNRESGEKAQFSASKVLQFRNRKGREKGGVVLIFPEGGCTPPSGELKPFKKGVWYLAKESGKPVVPAGLSGTRDIRLKPSTIFRRKRVAHVDVNFGEPLYAHEFTGKDADEQFLKELRHRIEQLRG